MTPQTPQTPPAADTRYDYRQLTIPLGIRITPVQTRMYAGQWHVAAAAAADAIIARYLTEAHREGWEPEGSSSFLALVTRGQARFEAKYGAITGEWKYTDYLSVVVTLRRVVA
jgi:hypothetical protein